MTINDTAQGGQTTSRGSFGRYARRTALVAAGALAGGGGVLAVVDNSPEQNGVVNAQADSGGFHGWVDRMQQRLGHTNPRDTVEVPIEPDGTKASVYEFQFPTDGSQLAPTDLPQMTELMSELSDNPDARIYIVGCADTTAGDAHNEALASERAAAIGNTLNTFGLGDRIGSFSLGEECPTIGPDNVANQEKRRTSIFVHAPQRGTPGVTGP